MRQKLKFLRVKNGISQKQMAEAIGISPAAYSYIESGKNDGSLETWKLIQKKLNIKNEDMWSFQTSKN